MWTGIPGLDAAAGSMDVPLDEGGVSDNGGREARPPGAAGDSFASATPIGGLTTRTLEPGITRVATLTLNVAAEPGVYHVTVADGQYLDPGETPGQLPMTAGPAFEIRVGRE